MKNNFRPGLNIYGGFYLFRYLNIIVFLNNLYLLAIVGLEINAQEIKYSGPSVYDVID
jgi:hypothetical protein